jgi:hypothetical protein
MWIESISNLMKIILIKKLIYQIIIYRFIILISENYVTKYLIDKKSNINSVT